MNNEAILAGLKLTEEGFYRGMANLKKAESIAQGELKLLLQMAISGFEDSELPFDEVMQALCDNTGSTR